MTVRSHCPSCRHRLSPLALECPVCGLSLERQALPKPLLFQASALQAKPVQAGAGIARTAAAQEGRTRAVSAPALGRVAPVVLNETSSIPELPPAAPEPIREAQAPDSTVESFWPLVRLEATEAGVLLVINLVLVLLADWMVGASFERVYGELWPFLLPVHVAISWAFEMVPITLVGQSPFMSSLGLLLDSAQPERRITFSLFHLVSVCLFPISFLCMILTPYHRTLAEVLTGQEILSRPLPRMR